MDEDSRVISSIAIKTEEKIQRQFNNIPASATPNRSLFTDPDYQLHALSNWFSYSPSGLIFF